MMVSFSGAAILLFSILCIEHVFSCGYETCPSGYNRSQLHLHIIAHSHDDVGWLATADGYAHNDVSPLLSAVTDALLRNFDRKFVEVEMYYFSRWWKRQSPDVHEIVRRLVKRGQLTFAGGGWCVADEATTTYGSIIDQMSLGIDFIKDTFGDCAIPKLSWQIDPFGPSREVAHLFALSFDAHVTNRGNDQLFGEFIWNTSSDGQEIFTTRMHHHYHAPDGFNFEDTDEITEANKHAKAKLLVELGRKWDKDYGSKGHTLLTFGHDFSYKHAERWFSNLDKLIEVVNADYPDVHLHYSSPHCYTKAVRDLKLKLQVKSGDFFPYWTGYFSSRPVVKYLDRFAGNLMTAAKQLEVIASLPNAQPFIYEAKNQLAVLQHHDAITGTSRPDVMLDYKQRLVSSLKASSAVISQAIAKLTAKSTSSSDQPFIYTTVNISDFTVHLNKSAIAVIIYNPLAQTHSSWIRLPVTSSSSYKVLYENGTQVQPVSLVPINDKVKAMVGHHLEVTHELVFEAHSLPALGFTTFFVAHESANAPVHKTAGKLDTDSNKNYLLKGSNFQLLIDHKTGGIINILKGTHTNHLTQNFAYYTAHRSSDSYRFCPTKAAFNLHNETVVQTGKYGGFSEVTQKVNEWIWQTVRVFENRPYIELDWIVGPIEDKDGISKEVISRFETKLKTSGTWYTDANGRQMMPRHRSQVTQTCNGVKEHYSLNYYPVTSQVAIKDELMEHGPTMSVFTDRSVGAASQTDGTLELMVHRRLLDRLGNGIDMNDLDTDGKGVVARGKMLLMFSDNEEEVANGRRQLSRALANQPVIAVQPIDSVEKYQKAHNLHYSALATPLPANLHLLTLENVGNLKNNQIRLRVENIYEHSDKSKLAVEEKLPLNTFSSLQIKSINKVNLFGFGVKTQLNDHQFTLKPNEIGTYLLNVTRTLPSFPCPLKWERLHDGKKLPAHSVVAGHESNGTPLFVCRHPNSEDLLPGKYSQSIHCRISNGGQEMIFSDEKVEVLVDSNEGASTSGNYQWVPRHGGDAVPDQAFVVGHAHGVPMYVGRCFKDGLVVGKIDEYFYYAYGRKEHKDCVDHQILTC